MTYYISGLSTNPRYSPFFTPLGENGKKFDYLQDPTGIPFNLQAGFRLDQDTHPAVGEVYKSAQLTSAHKTLPNIFHLSSEIAVDEIVKAMIERFEPNTHQFFPVRLLKKNGEQFEARYFLINICQRISAVDALKSGYKFVDDGRGGKAALKPAGPNPRIVRKASIHGMHLWREDIFPREMYMSDGLVSELKDLRIKGIDRHNFVVTIEN